MESTSRHTSITAVAQRRRGGRLTNAARRSARAGIASPLILLLALAVSSHAVRGQSFAPPVPYPVGAGAQDIVAGDFNRDGKPDLATVNNSAATVSVLLGNGDGTYRAAVSYATGPSPRKLAAGDVNHDGSTDLVFSDQSPDRSHVNVSVLLGNGDGTFRAETSTQERGSPEGLALGDFNGDGSADLFEVFGGTNRVNNLVYLRLSNGDGTFRAATSYYIYNPPKVAVIADFNNDGKADVAVTFEISEGPGLAVYLGNGDGTLKQYTDYDAASGNVVKMAAGDFNGDGNPDIAVASNGSGNKLSLLLGNGDGTFRPRIDTPVTAFEQMIPADVDGDGKLDLLTLTAGGGGVLGVLGGNGDGTFRAPKNYLVGSQIGAGAIGLASGDFNGDGRTDAAVSGGSYAAVMLNRAGSLSISGRVADQSGAGLGGVTITLSGGATGIATTAADGSYSFTGLAAGFNYSLVVSRTNYAFSPTQQNFTSITTDQTANFTGTLLTFNVGGTVRDGSGAGVGGVTVTVSGGASAVTTTAADGTYSFPSLPAAGNYTVTPSAARRVFNPASLSFSNLSANRVANFAISLATYSITVNVRDPNLNEYLIPPTATISGTVNKTITGGANVSPGFGNLPVGGNYTVTAGQPQTPFTNYLLAPPLSQTYNDLTASQTFNVAAKILSFATGPGYPGDSVAADFNGDGKIDLLVLTSDGNGSSGGLSLLPGNGDGTFQSPSWHVSTSSPFRAVVGDFNGDGKLDAAVSFAPSNLVGVLLGNGDGTFRDPAYFPTGLFTQMIAAGDLNGDGKLDLAVSFAGSQANSYGLSVLLGNGDGTFRPKVDYPLNFQATYVVLADVNGDGKPDVLTANNVLMNNGDGTLRAPAALAPIPPYGAPYGAVAADFDGDGKPDLFTTGRSGSGASFFHGNGDGTFRAPLTIPTTYDADAACVADFNGDGKLDVALSTSFSVTLMTGNGDGTFQPYDLYFFGGLSPRGLAVGDFNRDGRPDLAFANTSGSRRLSVLLNQMRTWIQFDANSYRANEGDGRALITVVRGGDLSGTSTVNYATVDDQTPIRCDTVNGKAYARCDYASVVDTLVFAPGESRKTIAVPLIDDAFAEGSETVDVRLSDPGGAILSGKPAATLTIIDNDTAAGPNPIGSTDFFVRQQYLDFLSREPEPGQPWSAVLNNCPPNDTTCDRVHVSAAFFGSAEFKLKGFYVFRFYIVSMRRLPTYAEMITDMRSVTATTTAELVAKRRAFADNWMNRQDFTWYTSATGDAFIAVLLNPYNLTQITTPDPQNPDGGQKVTLTRADLSSRLSSATLTRAQVLRAVVESDEVAAAESNRAFVTMQYFGYLRRDPEDPGFTNWLNTINADPNNARSMVNGFVNSTEYRLRFGQP